MLIFFLLLGWIMCVVYGTSDDRRRCSGGEESEIAKLEHPKPEGEESARRRIKIEHAKLKPKHDGE